MQAISEKLSKVLTSELGLDLWSFGREMEANQVPGWDSLSHIRIMVAIEKEYNIRFKNSEYSKLKNIGQLQDLVDLKLASAVR